jgi:hypothetical protein
MRRSPSLLLAALFALVAASCGSGGSSGGGASTPPTLDAQRVLDFSLPSVEGPTIEGADYSGKALALWFWAPW